MDRDKLSNDEKFKLLVKYDNICLKNIGKEDTYKGLTQCKKKLVNYMCPDHGADIHYNKRAIVNIIQEKLKLVNQTRGKKRRGMVICNLLSFVADNSFGFLQNEQKFTVTVHDKFYQLLMVEPYFRIDINKNKWLKIYENYLKLFPLKSEEKHLDYYSKINKKEKSKKTATFYPEQMVIVI